MSNSLDWISKVSIGTFVNASSSDIYSDFTSKWISLLPKSRNKLVLTPGFSGRSQKEYYRIWIDFNGDKDFSDAGELVFSVNNSTKSTVSGTLNIPANASGKTRLRIAMKNGSAPTACETFKNGEVEDYTVSFSADVAGEPLTNEKESIHIYPNPSTGMVHIETSAEQSEVFIFSSKGQLIKHLIAVSNETLNLDDLPKGLYFIKILTQNESKTQKLILQ